MTVHGGEKDEYMDIWKRQKEKEKERARHGGSKRGLKVAPQEWGEGGVEYR